MSIGSLPPSIRAAIELRKAEGMVAAEIAKLSWGQNIGDVTRRAVAAWGRQFNVDVTTEIDVLGNKIYTNARFYLRRLGELVADGLVEYAVADHVQADARLDQMGENGAKEKLRRLEERVRWGVADAAVGAVVFRVKLRSMDQEIVGVNWCGGGTRKSDPVGDAEPIKTAESRAARRAMRQLVSHVPRLAEELSSAEVAAERIEARIHDDHEEVRRPSALSGATVADPLAAIGAGSGPQDAFAVAQRDLDEDRRIAALERGDAEEPAA